MTNVVSFPGKGNSDPWDDECMCTIEINGKGDVSLVLNVARIETVEQHNWLVAKVSEAITRIIDHKNEQSSAAE